MKILPMIIILLLICPTAYTIDGEIYFGKYFDKTTIRSAPMEYDSPLYISGIKIGEKIDRLYLYTEFITLMDELNSDSFHPSSIEYIIGADLNIYKQINLEFEHSCWHPIDTNTGIEQYNLIKLKYKF